jgi:tellurite methyltransferase
MSGSDARSWDERYLAGEFGHREPDAFVMDAHKNYLAPVLPVGSTGLDLAGGAGHHAIWLAQRGWRMTLVDTSNVALEIAAKKIGSQSPRDEIEIVHAAASEALERFRETHRQFGFVLVSFFLERNLLPLLPELLISGGLLLYRTYTVENERLGNPRGPRNLDFLLRPQELLEVYRRMRILHYNETVAEKGVVELIAQRADEDDTGQV